MNKLPIIWRWLLFAGMIAAVAGCTADEEVSTVEPTLPLIAATLTLTPSPPPPTPTLNVTDSPAVTIDVVPTPTETIVPSDAPLTEVDPIAAELVFIAQRVVADETGLPTRRIRVVSIQPVLWRDSSLGCLIAGQVNTQVETPGYRIVLAAADSEYLFHTDIDRVIPCEPENEILPADVIAVTAEAAEATDEP